MKFLRSKPQPRHRHRPRVRFETLESRRVLAAPIHTLTTGDGDGDLTIDVDPYGTFGTNAFSPATGTARYDPIGPIQQASAVFRSAIAIEPSSVATKRVPPSVEAKMSVILVEDDRLAER